MKNKKVVSIQDRSFMARRWPRKNAKKKFLCNWSIGGASVLACDLNLTNALNRLRLARTLAPPKKSFAFFAFFAVDKIIGVHVIAARDFVKTGCVQNSPPPNRPAIFQSDRRRFSNPNARGRADIFPDSSARV